MLARYLRLFGVQLKASMLLALQYRTDFFIDAAIEVIWAGMAIVPLFVVYGARASVAGWSFGEALLVVGWFTLLQAVLEGAINPSLTAVVEHVRKGTLDLVLLKPADAQFLLSTARFSPWRSVNVVTAAVLFFYGFRLLGHGPSAGGVALSLVLFACSTALLYAFWILTVSAAFYVVRVDNLTYLFTSVFDAARWPSSVFRGVWHVVFTFVLPFAVMTTYPAEALLGTLTTGAFAGAVLSALAFLAVARAVWVRAIRQYTSAGG